MIEILADDEIEQMLKEQSVGRLAVHADGQTYLVPIAYAYANGCIYGHSAEGRKVRMMRKNPYVCFEVDAVGDLFTWRSVIAWGTFEELHGDDADEAMHILLLRFLPMKTHPTVRSMSQPRPGVDPSAAIIYRIHLTEKTGRFERTALT